MTNAGDRLAKELVRIEDDLPSDITAHPAGGDILEWTVIMSGPRDTPYAGGKYIISIRFPPRYPLEAPKVIFKTKIYHPNISTIDGTVFINVLFYDWCPGMTAANLLISLQSMLGEPIADAAVEVEIAHQYETDREGFERTARKWTKKYAMTRTDDNEESKT